MKMLHSVTTHVMFATTFLVCAFLMRECSRDYQYQTDASTSGEFTSGISRTFVFMDTVDWTFTYLEKAVGRIDGLDEPRIQTKALKTTFGIDLAFGAAGTSPHSVNACMKLLAKFLQALVSAISVLMLIVLEVTRVIFLTYIVIVNVLYYVTVPVLIAASLFMTSSFVSCNIFDDETMNTLFTGVLIYSIGTDTAPTMIYLALQPVVKIIYVIALTVLLTCVLCNFRLKLFSYPKSRAYEMDYALD